MRLMPLVLAALALSVTGSAAHHKPGHHIPPGQAKKMLPADIIIVAPPPEVEEVCLVTTERPGDLFAPVIFTEWLPRDVAEAAVEERNSFIVYHPDFNTEAGCVGF